MSADQDFLWETQGSKEEAVSLLMNLILFLL